MSRVLPTNNADWAVRLSILRKKGRPSGKKASKADRKVRVKRLTMLEKSQKWEHGLVNFIAQSKKQIISDAQETIKKVEQWERRTCAIFDMLHHMHMDQHNLQTDRHESKLPVKIGTNATKKRSAKTRCAKKAPATAKKPLAVSKKPSVAAKAPAQKPPAKRTAKKKSASAIKKAVGKSSKQTADASAQQKAACLPDLTSDSSSEEDSVSTTESTACPSMPILMEGADCDDNLGAFLTEPIESPAKVPAKRRPSDSTPLVLSDFPVRQRTMPVHSSVLATAKRTPNIVHSLSNGELNISAKASTPVSIVDKSNNARKVVEKEPAPIRNFLKDDDGFAKFMELKELMNKVAKKSAQKEPVLSGTNDVTSSKASPTQEPSMEL